METTDVTVEILKDIRTELRTGREEMRGEMQGLRGEMQELRGEIRQTNERLGHVETTLLDLAMQQRFVVRYTKSLAERDARVEVRVDDLETRVEKIEAAREPPRRKPSR